MQGYRWLFCLIFYRHFRFHPHPSLLHFHLDRVRDIHEVRLECSAAPQRATSPLLDLEGGPI